MYKYIWHKWKCLESSLYFYMSCLFTVSLSFFLFLSILTLHVSLYISLSHSLSLSLTHTHTPRSLLSLFLAFSSNYGRILLRPPRVGRLTRCWLSGIVSSVYSKNTQHRYGVSQKSLHILFAEGEIAMGEKEEEKERERKRERRENERELLFLWRGCVNYNISLLTTFSLLHLII